MITDEERKAIKARYKAARGALIYSGLTEKQISQIGVSFDDIPVLLAALDEKDAEIERMRKAERWVPVTERLPQAGKDVLAMEDHVRDTYIAKFDGKAWTDDLGFPAVFGVTHWRPIPAAPVKEGT